MKIGIFLFSLLIMSCSGINDDIDYAGIMNNSQFLSRKRSYEEALKVAEQSISIISDKQTRSANDNRTIDIKSQKYITSRIKTRSGSDIRDTLMYVFNFTNNKGFAIVSANLNTEALIAVTDKGYYDPEEEQDNQGFALYIEMAKDYISNADTMGLKKDPLRAHVLHRYVEEVISDDAIGRLINLDWGQQGVEGTLCPNGICGCGPLAMAMSMSYYEYPLSMQMNYDSINIHNATFDWSSMKLHTIKHEYLDWNCNATDNAHLLISKLCRQLGKTSNSVYYNNNGTSTSLLDIKNTLDSYGYTTNYWISYVKDSVVSQINNYHPMIMFGSYEYSDTGHFWILDGYRTRVIYIHEQEKGPNDPDWVDVEITGPFTNNYNHINWGWDGHSNGWFSEGVFNANSPKFLDKLLDCSINIYNSYLYLLRFYH